MKTCITCGSLNNDNYTRCSVCGGRLSNVVESSNLVLEKPKVKKKIHPLVIYLLVMCIVLGGVVGFAMLQKYFRILPLDGGGESPKEVVEMYMDGTINNKKELYRNSLIFFQQPPKDFIFINYIPTIKEYDFINVVDYSNDELEALQEEIRDESETYIKIQNAAKVYIEAEGSYSYSTLEDDYELYFYEFITVKCKGKWYIYEP